MECLKEGLFGRSCRMIYLEDIKNKLKERIEESNDWRDKPEQNVNKFYLEL
tara:strand:- start:245 stop:397 length:153 start_codon:yes stop_codon:yes gene_type:complete